MVVVRRTGVRTTVRGAVEVLLSAVGAVDVATPARSAAVMLSSGVYGRLAAAVDRSELSALSDAVILLSPFEQANARNAAGRISNFLNISKPPGDDPRVLRRYCIKGQTMCHNRRLLRLPWRRITHAQLPDRP